MRIARRWVILALAPWLAGAGCPEISSEQPLGEEIAVLDPQKMDGIWISPEWLLRVRVLDAQEGKLMAWPIADYGRIDRPLQCEPPSIKPGDCPDSFFGCVLVVRRQTTPLFNASYYFIYGEKKPDAPNFKSDIAFLSDGATFALGHRFIGQDLLDMRLKELVEKGALPGGVDSKETVILGPLRPEHYSLMLAPDTGLIDRTQPPFPLIKLPDALDPCKKSSQSE